MTPAEATTAKRKVLVETLLMCLAKSRVKEVVDLDTIGSVLQSAMGELWREGEFRLEVPWKILSREPGLSEDDVKGPLLVFKTYEPELGVRVRLPDALAEIPEEERMVLREGMGLGAEDFANVVERLRSIEQEEAQKRDALKAAEQAASAPEAAPKLAPIKRRVPWLQVALASALLAGSGIWLYLSLRNPAAPFDVSDVAPLLQLEEAAIQDKTLAAKIADPRWNGLSKQQQLDLLGKVFDRQKLKGIELMTLRDGERLRAMASEFAGVRTVEVY